MKKIILFITILLILTGCNQQKDNTDNDTSNIEDTNDITINENNDEITDIDIYEDENPVKVAFYENNKIVKSYKTTLSNLKDIAVFDIYYTNDEQVTEKNTKSNYQKYYNQYEDISNIKTGFYFEFEADGKKIEHLALDPNSQFAMSPYLYIYLYDDVNQAPNTYYSHLETDDVDENTVFSSIKLFLADGGTKITSPITLTVFTYDSDDDFTEDKKYRGISSYTITIDIN